jgi:putative flippase GtrA
MLARLNVDSKVFKFLLVGGLNTLLGFGLFPTVYWFMTDYRGYYVWMLVVCHITNVSCAYFSNKYFVFRTQGDVVAEMTKFVSFHVAYFFLMLLLVPFFVEYAHFNPMVIQFSISIVVVISSFFWYDKVVFLLKNK